MANASLFNLSCCHVCGEWMRKDDDLMLLHLNTHHRPKGKGMFSCPFCIKLYTRKWTLDRHVINIHKRIPPTQSIKTFTESTTLSTGKKRNIHYWPTTYTPNSVQFRVLFANNSPYPSCSQAAVNHPPRTLLLQPNPQPSPI